MTGRARGLPWLLALAALAALAGGAAHAADRPPSLVITPPPVAPMPRAVATRRPPPPAAVPDVATGEDDVTLEITEHVQRYPVPGADLASLRQALADQALADAIGGSHGRTRSDIRVEYAPTDVPGGCIARAPAITLTITTTLPEWSPAGVPEPGVAARWQAVAAALQRHEARHREHALAAVRDLQSSIAELPRAADCDALRRAVDTAFLRVRLKAEFRDRRYDARTRNGRDEGAVL